MKLFHIASKSNAETILRDGFRDVMGYHHAGQEWTGVWVSSEPLDWSQRQYLNDAHILFTIEIPEKAISEFEWVEEGKTLREWLIPAAQLNSYGPPVVTDDYDGDQITPNPGPEEDELLIEWANERPNVERLRTRNPDPGAFMGDFDMGEFLR
jgi:hypothetical protein